MPKPPERPPKRNIQNFFTLRKNHDGTISRSDRGIGPWTPERRELRPEIARKFKTPWAGEVTGTALQLFENRGPEYKKKPPKH